MLEATGVSRKENDTIIATLPYYHIYGICLSSHIFAPIGLNRMHLGVVQLLFWELYLGISTIILPRFNPEDFCAAIERYKITTAFIVPPIVLALVHHPGTFI